MGGWSGIHAIGINAPKRQHNSRAYLTHQQVGQLAAAAGGVEGLVVNLLAYTEKACDGVSWLRSRWGLSTCCVVAFRSTKL
jgi:hypothetical protein